MDYIVYVGNGGFKGMNKEIYNAIETLEKTDKILEECDRFRPVEAICLIENFLIKKDCFEIRYKSNSFDDYNLYDYHIVNAYYMLCSYYHNCELKKYLDKLSDYTFEPFKDIYNSNSLLYLYKLLNIKCDNGSDFYYDFNGVLIGYTVDGFLKKYDKLYIPNDTIVIERGAFEGNDDIKELYVPSNVKEIRNYAFNKCQNLSIVHFSEGLEYIDDEAFEGCSIKEVVLPKSIKAISSRSLGNVYKIDIPPSIDLGKFEYWEDRKFIFHDRNQIEGLKKLEENNNKLVGIDETTNEIFYSTN